MDIITTGNLTKIYGKDDTSVTAVDHLNMTIAAGSFTSIVGTSGSGKSTLLHLLGGVDNPTEGDVYLEGQSIFELNDEKRSILRRRKIGFVFQEYHLIPVLTVEENIAMPVLLDDKKVDREELDELLNRLGLYERRKHLPNELSGGQKQRAAIGRALINHPPLLLADEPTGNLDKKNSEEVMELMLSTVREREMTMVLITHEPDIAG